MSDEERFLTRWSRRKRANTSPRLRGESQPSGEDPRVGEPGEGDSQRAPAGTPPHPDPLPASGERELVVPVDRHYFRSDFR